MAAQGPCARSRRERWLEKRVSLWATTKAKLSTLVKPGARVTTIAVAIYGAAALANSQDWPKKATWDSTAGTTVLVVSGVLSIVGYCLVTLGYSRALKRQEEDARLSAACRSIARIVESAAGIDHRDVGVHVWTKAGGRIAPHLARRVRYLPEERQDSAVTWTRGKGVIGLCWQTDSAKVVNLAGLENRGSTEEQFCALPAAVRLNLTWLEFERTRRYRAVCALPLRGGPEGAKKFLGCVSIDVRTDGHVDSLRQALDAQSAKLGRVLTVCEAALAKDSG